LPFSSPFVAELRCERLVERVVPRLNDATATEKTPDKLGSLLIQSRGRRRKEAVIDTSSKETNRWSQIASDGRPLLGALHRGNSKSANLFHLVIGRALRTALYVERWELRCAQIRNRDIAKTSAFYRFQNTPRPFREELIAHRLG
jgi:hypothetical protein